MDKTFNHIRKKSENGIPYSDAVLVMLAIFCTHDVLPNECRGENLGRKELAIIFSKLSMAGKIIVGADENVQRSDIMNPEHWNNVIIALLRKKINLDKAFWERIALYV